MLRRRPQATWPPKHDDDHGQRNQQLTQDGRVQTPTRHLLQRPRHIAQGFGQSGQQHRAQNDAGQMAQASQNHHRHNHHRLHQAERLWGHKALKRRKHRPRHTAKGRAHAKGHEFQVAGVQAHGFGRDFVFTNGHPSAADARVFEPRTQHHAHHHQGQEQVVIQGHRGQLKEAQIQTPRQGVAKDRHRINLPQAFGAIGDVDGVVQVVQKHADDFAKAQRDDGQVIAAQLQRGRTQQETEQPRQARCQRQHQPQTHVQAIWKQGGDEGKRLGQMGRGHQTKQVSAHRKEGHIPQIQQTGVAHHDVQAQCQQHIEQRHVGNAHPSVAKALQHQGQHQRQAQDEPRLVEPAFRKISLCHVRQARSATRSPNRPEGRSVNTTMSTMNAKMSV